MPVVNPSALIDERVEAIRAFHRASGAHRAQLDLSGGIDSAVMAGLLVIALGPERLTLSHTIIHTNPVQTQQARQLASSVGSPLVVGDFTAAYEAVRGELLSSLQSAGFSSADVAQRMDDDATIEGSIRSCLRAPLGRGYNRMTGGGIRHGTGNECEDRFLRFYQKGGDGEVDTNPIDMLSKTEVFQLAYALAERLDAHRGYGPIIAAVPTPDLWGSGADHNDEDELLHWAGAPFTYGRVSPDSGKVLSFGTIEMVSRFVDSTQRRSDLFLDEVDDSAIGAIVADAIRDRDRHFPAVEATVIRELLHAARRAERTTRHKVNPNIPSLGNRAGLLEAGILSEDLAL